MNAHPHHPQASILHVNGGLRSKEMAQDLKAALEDLSGVYSTELTQDGVCLHFDPLPSSELQDDKVLKFPTKRSSDSAVPLKS
ncbi:MAG: hypothetical protein WDN28_20560 [Chthoniobacter sp.]